MTAQIISLRPPLPSLAPHPHASPFRVMVFAWQGKGWSLVDLMEPLPAYKRQILRFARGTARYEQKQGRWAFVVVQCGHQLREVPL